MTAANSVVLLGVPSDENSSFMRGPALAPAAIRKSLFNGASGLTAECGTDLAGRSGFRDDGDLEIAPADDWLASIEQPVRQRASRGVRPLLLGGDHAISYPALRAIVAVHGAVEILHFDAHPDLYDEYEGNRYSHASPFARVMEEGLATRLVQVGIRAQNAHLREQARRFGVESHVAAGFDAEGFAPMLRGPLYISIDLDALDPAFAPGVSHHEPGGLSMRDVLTVLQKQRAPVVGADIVEYNPRRDVHDMTAAVAAKLVKEIAALMLREGERADG
ncbi:MAG: agmatinase family protein [Gammaproteobacteria bacterium]|nr:agmatinase family protein [Gammaproteobacteria bacterium]NNF59848.1 agmatinase family protein [Gammaproteobacteria bacterium]NNM21278.1 agmatinase family protein [Gammaproteobacteria bacterium]